MTSRYLLMTDTNPILHVHSFAESVLGMKALMIIVVLYHFSIFKQKCNPFNLAHFGLFNYNVIYNESQ